MSKTGALGQLKVTLNGIRPPIWRRLSLPRTTTLDDLHSIILTAMGWFGGHLHMFEVGGRNYSDKFELEDALDESRITLNMLIRQGVDKFIYTYDFGDDWEHTIQIEKKQPTLEAPCTPICLEGSRNCPPEDIGGIYGYEQFLSALANPNTSESQEILESFDFGEAFDPEDFSVEKANARIAERLGFNSSVGKLPPLSG